MNLDPADQPSWCGHRECAASPECLRISDATAQPSMWHCPVVVCRRALLTFDGPGARRTFEVLNADRVRAGLDPSPILSAHACRGFSLN